MKCSDVFVAALLAVGAGNVIAEQLPAGAWLQTSSTAGDCADCQITVTKVTPQIVQVTSNNGWTGYAHYVSSNDRYVGRSNGKREKAATTRTSCSRLS